MKLPLLAFCILLFNLTAQSQTININGPAGSGAFGTTITVLSNGNYVVTDPSWDNGAIADVGAVYLYNGATNTLISTLKGSSASDAVGSAGITPLTNGNFVVKSTAWNNGAVTSAGAVTWCNGTTGLNATVGVGNSLVGSTASDQVGSGGVTALNNGNYVVGSPLWNNGAVADAGAATWGNGTTGRVGVVSSSNSLVGSSASDNVGSTGLVIQLTNSNYILRIFNWDNGAVSNAGAVAWGNGTTGTTGVVSAANALVGTTINDQVGASALITLNNGNYVVGSQGWDNGAIGGAGAATWCNGATGTFGAVSAANSLVGDHFGAEVGNRLTALTNGNYVVRSPFWNNGAVSNAGAVTWGNGTTGTTGIVSTANSLVGSSTDDQVGNSGLALTNGNYVVYTSGWNNGAVADVGAVTWRSGTGAATGTVGIANSLIGSTANDQAGNISVLALTNGNYVVSSSNWDDGAVTNAGAVTWGNGTTGTSGAISAANSIVGSTSNDGVGLGTIALTNGNYVAGSYNWDNGAIANAGAYRLCIGTSAISGVAGTGLVGSTINDQVGLNGLRALTNGNYLVNSSSWDNGAVADAGAVTWCSGTINTAGPVSSSNSLVGSTASDGIGSLGVIALTNGNYTVNSRFWDNGAVADAGAVTWGNGTTGTTGIVSESNSLAGSTTLDQVGEFTTFTTTDGNYMVRTDHWDNGAIVDGGAVSFGNGTSGTMGIITECNSVLGNITTAGVSYVYDTVYDQMIVGKIAENMVSVFDPSDTLTLASTAVCHTQNVIAGGTLYKNSCKLIAKVVPSGADPVAGSITACVTFDATQQYFNAEPYLQRHYDIEPATANTTTTSATITLYFMDAEFSTYNTNNPVWPKLPTVAGGGNSDPRRANLKITQYHGNATTNPSQPGMYTGNGGVGILIDPVDANIVWNGSYWAVTFDITGFSGFCVHTNNWNTPLPVAINYFTGVKQGSSHLLSWKITCNSSSRASMELQRSADGRGFNGINAITVNTARCNQSFDYRDDQPLKGMNYYRLKITDDHGKITYSNIVALLNAEKGFEITGILPNPVASGGLFKLNISSARSSPLYLKITDLQGRLLMQETKNIIAGFTSLDMNVVQLCSGTYYISAWNNEIEIRSIRFVKQ